MGGRADARRRSADLTSWWRALGPYVKDWRNAYNAAEHGLAVGVRPVQLAFLRAEGGGAPTLSLMNGPAMRTLEHEVVTDANGRRIKDLATGQYALRWFWMHRAIDPDELIAQTIVTADLLDWLAPSRRHVPLGRTGTPVHVRDEPKPLTLKRKTAPGISSGWTWLRCRYHRPRPPRSSPGRGRGRARRPRRAGPEAGRGGRSGRMSSGPSLASCPLRPPRFDYLGDAGTRPTRYTGDAACSSAT